MATVTVAILNTAPGQSILHGVTIVQFERENRRVYLQPAEGDPVRVDLAPGDSLIVTVEG